MISATAAGTSDPRGACVCRRQATSSSPPMPSTWALSQRSIRTQPLQQPVDGGGLELVRDGVGDQAGGALQDLLAHDEVVLAQRGAGGGEVDDRLHQVGERRQLDGALDLHDLRLPTRLLEMRGGNV